MALKKYSDFAKSSDYPKKSEDFEPLKEKTKVVTSIVETKVEPKVEEMKVEPKVEKQLPIFNGKVVKFPDNFKPSVAHKILENKNFSKEKLHYIITEQGDNALLVVKYNQDAPINLKEFSQAVISYYCKNDVLKEQFKHIVVEGNSCYAIIKGIPILELNGIRVIKIINDDLIKLLK
jgi:hypothetical protein